MSIKIGISPICWQNDDLPDITSVYTMRQALQESRQIGYIGVERGQRMPQDTESLRSYLEQYNIALCGGWCSGATLVNDFVDETQAIQRQVQQFIDLNAPCIVYAECSNTIQSQQTIPISQRPSLSKDEMRVYAQRLSDIAKWSVDQGMPMAYHHHMGTIVESEDDINWLMEYSQPELELCFDTGHLIFANGNIHTTLDRWSHRIRHVHFKDVRPTVIADIKREDRSFLDAVLAGAFTVPGDGSINFQEVANKLKDMEYKGWIVVEAEQDPQMAQPYEYSKIGYQHILKICANSGLEISNEA